MFQDSQNIVLLLLVRTISTHNRHLWNQSAQNKFVKQIYTTPYQVQIHKQSNMADTLPECFTLHKTQFFKEALEIKFKAFIDMLPLTILLYYNSWN